MNGGDFPFHQTHQDGIDADGLVDNYRRLDKAVALKVVEVINQANAVLLTTPWRLAKVWVTDCGDPQIPTASQAWKDYGHGRSTAFWEAIKDAKLADGRPVKEIIEPKLKHDDHFHFRFALRQPPPRSKWESLASCSS